MRERLAAHKLTLNLTNIFLLPFSPITISLLSYSPGHETFLPPADPQDNEATGPHETAAAKLRQRPTVRVLGLNVRFDEFAADHLQQLRDGELRRPQESRQTGKKKTKLQFNFRRFAVKKVRGAGFELIVIGRT